MPTTTLTYVSRISSMETKNPIIHPTRRLLQVLVGSIRFLWHKPLVCVCIYIWAQGLIRQCQGDCILNSKKLMGYYCTYFIRLILSNFCWIILFYLLEFFTRNKFSGSVHLRADLCCQLEPSRLVIKLATRPTFSIKIIWKML